MKTLRSARLEIACRSEPPAHVHGPFTTAVPSVGWMSVPIGQRKSPDVLRGGDMTSLKPTNGARIKGAPDWAR
jgi:hypothetical protein